ncbi:MAG: copper chaperone CopZ [Lachnospiraceae bacterium]|jgi:copper chaperone|nr:copper chaperone CopZ [Lachnospiraceae bacterium]
MENTIIHVNGMSCQHCVKAVTNAVGALNGVSDVEVDLKAKTATVGFDKEKITLDKIKAAIEDQGYNVV